MKHRLLGFLRYSLAVLCFLFVAVVTTYVLFCLFLYTFGTPDVINVTHQKFTRGAASGATTTTAIRISGSNWRVWCSILLGLVAGAGAATLVLRPYLLKRVPKDVWWMMAPVCGLVVFGLWKLFVPPPVEPRHAPPDMIGKFHYDCTGQDITKGGYTETILLDEENKNDRLRIAQSVVKLRQANRGAKRAGEYIDVLFLDPDQDNALLNPQPRHRITWTPKMGFQNRY
ncbi:MAG: hypothetical protein JO316_17245 [Abitibacteriaceae bacterium]|nr:hypothetical protein [Abditibacteriaceae bacterium]MBV9867103.1 hypothetical protein [Abditibacteriaceae bacterium]